MFKKVVFPDPEGPTIAVNSPCLKLIDTSFKALTLISPWLYIFFKFLVSITFIRYYIDLTATAGSSLRALLAGKSEEIKVNRKVKRVMFI